MADVFINGRFLVRPITGVERFAIEIIKALIKQGVSVKIVAPVKAKKQKEIDAKFVVYSGIFSGHFWEQLILPLFLKKQKKPLLLNLANTAPIIYSNKLVTLHDIAYHEHPEWFNKIFVLAYKILIPKILRTARFIFTVSEFSKKSICNVYGIEDAKIGIIYNGLPEVFLQAKPEKKLFDFNYVLTVGSIQPRKNLLRLIKAYNQLQNPEFKLVVVGGSNKIFSNIGNKDITHSSEIIFLDRVNDAELASLYKYCNKFVYPSLYEGFGLPVMEALHFNCNVYISDIPVFKELFLDAVYFFNPTDINDISEKLLANNLKKDKITVLNKIKSYNFKQSAIIIKENIERIKSSICT